MSVGKNIVVPGIAPTNGGYQFVYFGSLLDRPVVAEGPEGRRKVGKLEDLVFALKEPYPEVVGLYIEHGWGKPTEFVPWKNVRDVGPKRIVVDPPEGEAYPPFVDQPGWLMLGEHLLGRTILDIDGRRTEVVNDVHLLASRGTLLLVHVDASLGGFFRRWGLGRLNWIKDELISWKFVQPFSVEDAVATDRVRLSVTRAQMLELPSEDLADALEELRGEEQQALFSALDAEKAAETLLEAEPRAQRQLVSNLGSEQARAILAEMSIVQLGALFTVLPHDDVTELLALLPPDLAARVDALLHEPQYRAESLADQAYVAVAPTATVGETLASLRGSGRDPDEISYCYVLEPGTKRLAGVIDLRELVLAPDDAFLSNVMNAPVVAVEKDAGPEDLASVFSKYHYRMVPVVDAEDGMLGVIRYNDFMKGPDARTAEKD